MSRVAILVACIIVLLSASIAEGAGVPQRINYQAVLLDDGGNPVTDLVNVTFRIHDNATRGAILWEQYVTGIQPDDNGQFSLILGEEMNPITEDILTGEQRWLGIQVEGDPDEMSPRTELVSSTYSFRVNTVDGAAAGIIYGPLTIEESLAKAADAEVIVACSAKSPYTVKISPCNGTVLQATDDTDVLGEWGILAPGQTYIGMTDFSAKAEGASIRIRPPSIDLAEAFSITNSSGDETFQIESDGSSASVNFYSAGFKASALKARVATDGFALFGDTESDEVLNIVEESPGLASATFTDYSAKAAGASVKIRPPSAALAEVFTVSNSSGDATFQIGSDGSSASVNFYSAGAKAASLKARVATDGFALFGDSESDEVLNIVEESPGLASATFTDYSAKAAGASVKIRPPTSLSNEVFTVSTSTGDPSFQLETDPSGATSMSFANTSAKATDRLVINSDGIFFLDEAKSDTLARITKAGNIVAKGQIAMGANAVASEYTTTLGPLNQALNETCVVIGVNNKARDFACAALSGSGNDVAGRSSVVPGGGGNQTLMKYSTISGGATNKTYGEYNTISGGINNTAGLATKGPNADPKLDVNATVGGGMQNTAGNQNTTVCGGQSNTASGPLSFAGGGQSNSAIGDGSCVVAGSGNKALGDYATLGGGFHGYAGGWGSVIGGGQYCKADSGTSDYSTIAGGSYNRASGKFCVVGGGGGYDSTHGNVASGWTATVPGGRGNVAHGSGSFAAGVAARANHKGSMVFSATGEYPGLDSVMSGGEGQMVMRLPGCLYLTKTGGTAPYDTTKLINSYTGAYLSTGGAWTDASDRNLKENFGSVDGWEILEKIAGLEITRWNYRSEPENITHIGPMGQDFYAAFGVGKDEKSIAALDEAGIALAAIKELYRTQLQLKEKTKEIDELKAQLTQLANQVQMLQASQKSPGSGDPNLTLNR